MNQGQEKDIENEMSLEEHMRAKPGRGWLAMLKNFVIVIRMMGCHRV